MNTTDDPLTPVWKALSDPTRRHILDLLKEQARTTGQLCNAFELSRFAVMKHLAVLGDAGLVLVRRRGRERWNHLNAIPLQRIYERWLRPYEAEWVERLLRLEDFIHRKGETEMNEKPALDTLMTMHVEQDVSLSAPPERVFQALTDHVAGWWGAPYLLSEEATDLILEPKLGGSFYEVWGIDEGVLYATVTAIQHGRRLELTGPIGMDGAYQGIVVFELEPTGSGTSLHLTHRAFGELTPDTQANYASGWADLLGTRLKAYVERGERHGLK